MPPALETIGATGLENEENTGLQEVQDYLGLLLTLVPTTSPTDLNQFESLGQVPATCSSKRFV